MSSLPERLKAAGIHRALIVDDACDTIPHAADLAMDSSEWTNFFDDLTDGDRACAFPRSSRGFPAARPSLIAGVAIRRA